MLDDKEFRKQSQKKDGAVTMDGGYEDQRLCHRVPNKILLDAYNKTSDPDMKEEILRFNYSPANITR
eukprot:471218-Amphidinium_carterae.1